MVFWGSASEEVSSSGTSPSPLPQHYTVDDDYYADEAAAAENNNNNNTTTVEDAPGKYATSQQYGSTKNSSAKLQNRKTAVDAEPPDTADTSTESDATPPTAATQSHQKHSPGNKNASSSSNNNSNNSSGGGGNSKSKKRKASSASSSRSNSAAATSSNSQHGGGSGSGDNNSGNSNNQNDDGADHAADDENDNDNAPTIVWKPQDVQSTCEFTHTIFNYAQKRESGCKKAEYSAVTQDNLGNRWRLIIYVNGNGRASNHHLSLFLQVADADDLPFGWKKGVSYVLTLEHPTQSSLSYSKRNPDKTFKLCPKAIDWGWSQFITSDRIQQDGFVANDALTVRAQVTVKSSSVAIDEDDAELYLKCAVEEGEAKSVKVCLDQGASVNCQFKDDLYTPLHTACSSGTGTGSMEVLHLLLQEGADCNACNKWRETPLLIAANNGHRSAVDALVKHGADPSLCSEAGWSALTFAAHKVR